MNKLAGILDYCAIALTVYGVIAGLNFVTLVATGWCLGATAQRAWSNFTN